MKNFTSVLIVVLLLGIFSNGWSQLPIEKQETLIFEHEPQEQRQVEINYEDEVKESELQGSILKSIKETYSDFKISEAYRGSDGSYKILIEKEDNTLAVFYNAGGEFLRIEDEGEEENRNDDWR